MTSEIKADKWSPASGTAGAIGDSGDTFTIPSGVTLTNSGTATGFAPIGISSSMTSGSGLAIDSAGHVTMPLQSCFSAYYNGAQSNVTGDDTMYTVLFDTERFDLNGDFASNTFTAPVTGKYLLSSSIGLTGYTSSSTYSNMYLVTSNDTYSAFAGTQVENNFFFSFSIVADMDASDTAIVKVNAGGEGSKVVDVANGADGLCFFSGCLLA